MTTRVARGPGSCWLVVGGYLSFAAALAHLACIIFGAAWFRFFGAPELLVRSYEQGDPALVGMTVGIALVLAVWGLFALSGAGAFRRLPLLRTALVAITAIYLLRGASLVPAILMAPYLGSTFDLWSSVIALVYGLVHAIGLWMVWARLTPKV